MSKDEIFKLLKILVEESNNIFDENKFCGDILENIFIFIDSAYLCADNKFVIQFHESFGGENCGKEYYRIYKIIDLKGIETIKPIFIKFSGEYNSWDGVEWDGKGIDSFKIVKPQIINRIEWKE